MADISLNLVVLKTGKMDHLRAFYAALGVGLAQEKHGEGPLHYAGQVGDATLELYPLSDGADADMTTRLGFVVTNVPEVIQALNALGTQIISVPKQSAWGLRAVVRDPDGRSVELYERTLGRPGRNRDMEGNPQGIRSLAKYSKLPVERIKYVSEADEATVHSIQRGILFLMAFWSGSSVKAFAKLTEVLARMEADGLEIVVADVDGSPDLYELPEFKGKVHGAGETAWVRHGNIIATSGLGLNTACFEPNTLALMSLP